MQLDPLALDAFALGFSGREVDERLRFGLRRDDLHVLVEQQDRHFVGLADLQIGRIAQEGGKVADQVRFELMDVCLFPTEHLLDDQLRLDGRLNFILGARDATVHHGRQPFGVGVDIHPQIEVGIARRPQPLDGVDTSLAERVELLATDATGEVHLGIHEMEFDQAREE